MTPKAKEPRQQPTAPQAEADENDVQIPFEEMAASYEQQIGQLAGQLLQKDIVIRKLRQALVEKSQNRPE